MKNYVIIFVLLTASVFSCSKESIEEQPIQADIAKTDAVSQLMASISNNQDFIDYVQEKTNSVSARNGDDNGIMVIEDPFALLYVSFTPEGLVFVGAGKRSDNTITFMPNGMMRFRSQSNDPVASILNLNTFETSYSTDCYNNSKGSFVANVAGFYEEVEIFPGFNVYEAEEIQTASILRGHVKMNNAQAVFDENFEVIDCGEGTDEVTFRFKLIFRDNNGQGLEPIMDVSLN